MNVHTSTRQGSRDEAGRKTVFLCVHNGHHAANLLRTAVFRTLCGSERPLTIVILSPFLRDPRFVAEFETEHVRVEDLYNYDPPYFERVIFSILSEQFIRRTRLDALLTIRESRRMQAGVTDRLRSRLMRGVLASLPISPEAWLRLTDLIVPDRLYADVFRRYGPDLLVTPTSALQLPEIPLMKRAKAEGVRTLAVDLSWDNLTLKYHPMRRSDKLIVWSESMKREAVAYHGYSPEDIYISGPPHFDRYFQRDRMTPRETFFRRLGMDPARKLVSLMTLPRMAYPHHAYIARLLYEAIQAGTLDAQLLVRLHPQDGLELYEDVRKIEGVVLEYPYTPVVTSWGLQFDQTEADRQHLADTLFHSDVVVNLASTVTIEACILDRPVVNFNFDPEPNVPLPLSARRLFMFPHIKRIVEARATKIASNPGELVEFVARYLKDPSEEREARRRLVEQECHIPDGRAGERLGRLILECVP